MSLVGPRPLQVRDYELFETYCQDWQRKRFSVRPGITCLWQIMGRSSTTFEKWMELDLQYIRTWSLVAGSGNLGQDRSCRAAKVPGQRKIMAAVKPHYSQTYASRQII